MRKMLNTLYITTEDAYASLNGETVEINFPDGQNKRIPIHTLENIVAFSYKGASPALMGKCEEYGIPISFFSPHGRYLASVGASIKGNVLLRRKQHQVADNEKESLAIAKNLITGKLVNSRNIIDRGIRDHPMQMDVERMAVVIEHLNTSISQVELTDNMESLRGIEGAAASEYFSVFNELILQQKNDFVFTTRSKRPPMDRINALLSFAYTLLANECSSALLGVGLDPYVGFMHTDRPGRKSLALDIMEELRGNIADRLVLSLVNNRVMSEKDFDTFDSGAVLLNEEGRKKFLSKWQEHKRIEIVHPFLKEKIPWGLVPYSQAQLLARLLRGDLEQYPPFFWR